MIKKKEKNGIFNKLILINIVIDVIIIIFGCFLLFKPSISNKIIGILCGILLLCWAGSLIFSYIKRDGAKLYSLNIVFGSLIGVLGLVLILYPYTVITFVQVCIGLFLLVNGATKINYGLWLKKGNEETWIITLITGLFMIVISLLLMFTNIVAYSITQLIGIFLIISSILNLSDAILFKKRSKEIVKIFW